METWAIYRSVSAHARRAVQMAEGCVFGVAVPVDHNRTRFHNIAGVFPFFNKGRGKTPVSLLSPSSAVQAAS